MSCLTKRECWQKIPSVSEHERDVNKRHRQGYAVSFFLLAKFFFYFVIIIDPAVDTYPAEGRDEKPQAGAAAKGDIVENAAVIAMG